MAKIDKLKLRNFKSFKNVTVPIALGYTCIVGPNGSGKSNILDALSFVVGSSSMKSLRADKLVDLVNHNSADGTAEVTLEVADGGDRHEFTRNIDKAGQSVFRHNGRRTTKFQIEELLSKYKIKSDNHNIIMQDDMVRFIRMSPLQRRELIDEISGVAEYESKKEEALRELNKVQEKIKEASIILGERSGYLNILEKEKIEAEVYVKLLGEAKQLKATLSKKEYASTEKSLSNILTFINEKNAEIAKLQAESDAFAASLKKFDGEYEELNKKVFEESEKRQTGARTEVETLRNRIFVLEEKMNNLKGGIEKSSEEKQRCLGRISEIGNAVKQKESEIDKTMAEESDFDCKISEKKKEFEALLGNSGFSKLRQKYAEFEKTNAELESRRSEEYRLKSEMETIKERVSLKKSHMNTLGIGKMIEKEKELRARISDFEMRIAEERKGIEEKQAELLKLSAEEEENNLLLQKTDGHLIEKRSELSALTSSISAFKEFMGLSPAVEAVLKNNELRGILGTVADLCKYEEKYASSIETAAGNKLFYVITEDADSATKAVKYLKETKLGKATFIPLDKIKAPEMLPETEKVFRHPKTVDLALNLIQFDSKYSNAYKYVFADTAVVNDIDAAKEIGIGRGRMVTLDGDLCESVGTVTGGFNRKMSILQYKQLEQVRQTVLSLEKNREAVLNRLRTLRDRIIGFAEEKAKLELRVKETEVSLKEWRDRLDEYMKAIYDGETLVAATIKETEELEKLLTETGERVKKTEYEIFKLSAKRESFKKTFEDKKDTEIFEKEKELTILKDKKTEIQLRIRTLRNEIEKVMLPNSNELKKQASDIERHGAERAAEIGRLSAERNGLTGQLKSKEEKEREAATSVTGLFKKQMELNKKRTELSEQVGGLARITEKLKAEMNEKSIDKAKLEVYFVELKKDYEKYRDVEPLEGSIASLKEMLATAEQQLSRLGNVNMKAIEMFEVYSKEVSEIKEKSKKLGEERDSIVNMITEIENKKIRSFIETFNALNKYFDQYYKEFYPEPGSEASLKLENTDNPFESGLLVEAKPAGKHLKIIDLMSGGEKSIAALAFLFAVQAYSPSPFYVLDEADAALDAVNAERVARMLKKMSKDNQFIIITHNQYVIKDADQIIGVYMQKDGSSLIEVDLKGYQTEKLNQPAPSA